MVQSINRAMLIIQALSDSKKEKWLITELTEKTKLPISTVYRLIHSLSKHGLVTQIKDTKQYTLGYKWIELGLKMFEKLDVRMVARPFLEQLAHDVEETVYLNIPNDTNSIIIDRIESPRTVKIIDNIGERIPLHIGAANKTILANLPTLETKHILQQLLPNERERKTFAQELHEIQQKGYAVSFGEKTKGTIAFGAPLFDFNNQVLGAISIEVLDYNITNDRTDFLIKKAYESAHQISLSLRGE